MLKRIFISNPKDQDLIFDQFDPANSTWLVSDIRSKLDVQQKLLNKKGFLPSDAVLRASELWKIFLTRVRPDLRVVSREFVLVWLAQRLSHYEHQENSEPSTHSDISLDGMARTAYEYLTQLMPILSHPHGQDIMIEWFASHPASATRWHSWWDLCIKLWVDLLAEGIVALPWISGVLVNESLLTPFWSRALVVYLEADLNQVEADLLTQLSSMIDVTIVCPTPAWRSEFPRTMAAYSVFENKIHEEIEINKNGGMARSGSGNPEGLYLRQTSFVRQTTMLAEIKESVAKVRKWLDRGVELNRIAILAPDIEEYWVVLSEYLQQEGIPSSKSNLTLLHEFDDVSKWLARMRLYSGSFIEADLEASLFGSERQAAMDYERFRQFYSALYERKDLYRTKEVEDVFHSLEEDLTSTEKIMTKAEFVPWAIEHMPDASQWSALEDLLQRIELDCPSHYAMSLSQWVKFCEKLAARIEVKIQNGAADGLTCSNIGSGVMSEVSHLVLLGLTEEGLRENSKTGILLSDIMSLTQSYGFHLQSEDQMRREFAVRWLLEGSFEEIHLSTPETNFLGDILAPSWLWIRGARELGVENKVSVPRPTRWDELQAAQLQEMARNRVWTEPQFRYLQRRISEDLGETKLAPVSGVELRTLSPSAIEDYLDCPFIFAAKRLFGLSDVQEIDLDVDPLRRGSFMHKMLELLLEEPLRFQRTDQEWDVLLEKCKSESQLELADLRLWPSIKKKNRDLGERFLSFEKSYREMFPRMRTVARELVVEGYLRPTTGELVKTKEPDSVRFVGRIDRVDADEFGNLVILDYKSSISSASQYGQWIQKNQIQLLLYAMAIEGGLTNLGKKPVLGAFYYSMRPLNRDQGFKVECADQGLYDLDDKRKKNRISFEEKENLFSQGRGLIQKVISQIHSGEYEPHPRDPKDCTNCRWSQICRAPHLNS